LIRILGYNLDLSEVLYHSGYMAPRTETQRDRVISLLRQRGMARGSELLKAGVTATTVSRMQESGQIVQLGRGLYQLPDAPLDINNALAQAAKRVPKGIICLTSALAYHELTDTIPSRVWMAIGPKDWRPLVTSPAIQFVRFGAKVLDKGVKEHVIEGVPVRIYNPAKTVVDLFRYRQSAGKRYQKSPGLNLAIEGLREALRLRKATPSEIARYATEAGVWKIVQPYLEAMTANA
jgi:predicted transcriptional regulator of viral defense system